MLAGMLLSTAVQMWAIPAKPGLMTLTQPDGTPIEASVIGDEYFHYYETPAGELLLQDKDGYLRRAAIDRRGELVTVSAPTGLATPEEEAAAIREAAGNRHAAMKEKAARRVTPGKIPAKFPTTGVVRGLIIMAEFQDVKFTEKATPELYDKKINMAGYSDESTYGSVYDYFVKQSCGKFTPEFDVVGPVTLPHDCAWYGMEERLDDLFRDACTQADLAGTDFTKYDVNNDYFVDFVFVIYAGYGQAQGGPVEAIWPAMKDLSNSVYDYFDMMNLGVAACSCELKGNSGANLDGVGTICHEFSHILGLADIYDTTYQGAHGMCHYDIMDIGSYNDNQRTPSGYTAMDRYTLGWLEPEVLENSAEGITLDNLQESNKAYFIVNPDNPDEYFTLENRQQQGWDAGLPGHGLVISYCHYESRHWAANTVNAVTAAKYEHVRIVAADENWGTTAVNEAGDPFPGASDVRAFPGERHSAYLWQSSRQKPGFGITDIAENDGVVTFGFSSGSAGIDAVAAENQPVKVAGRDIVAPEGSVVYDMQGRLMTPNSLMPGVYIVKTPSQSVKVAVK